MKSCKESKVTYVIDGVENVELPGEISSYPLNVSHPNPRRPSRCTEASVLTIKVNDTENIKIWCLRGFLNLHVTGTAQNFGTVSGLIGTWGKDGMVSRDGITLIKDPVSHAQEWQIRGKEPDLFKESKHPLHPLKCVPPPAHKTSERRRAEEE